jgi:aryl-alcohol dehydrogenase-like predicted oxidoreductase
LQNSNPQISQLVLGTAQLGLKYGIANNKGQLGQHKAEEILNFAWNSGIRNLDTAQAYGNSEEVIGSFSRANPNKIFNVITKLPPNINYKNSREIRLANNTSWGRLGVPPGDILIHDAKLLNDWDGILGKTLTSMINNSEVKGIGVSVYEPDEFQKALTIPEITSIQAPFNVFDRRLLDAGLLTQATKLKKKVFIRSIFLQGLLLLRPEELPSKMSFALPTLIRWQKLCQNNFVSPLKASLGYVLSKAPNLSFVIGSETEKQIYENLLIIREPALNPNFLKALNSFQIDDPRIYSPANW